MHTYSSVKEGEVMVDLRPPAPEWRKSARCASASCVEVAKIDQTYLVRDSKNPDGGVLSFTSMEWQAFVAGVEAGDFKFE